MSIRRFYDWLNINQLEREIRFYNWFNFNLLEIEVSVGGPRMN